MVRREYKHRTIAARGKCRLREKTRGCDGICRVGRFRCSGNTDGRGGLLRRIEDFRVLLLGCAILLALFLG